MTVTLTNIQVWNQFWHGLPSKVHGSNALAKESKTWPCRVFDQVTCIQEYKMEWPGIQRNIKPALIKIYMSQLNLTVIGFYLDFSDNLFLRSVDVTAIYDANNVRICTLKGSNSCPQNPFAPSAGITSGLDCIRWCRERFSERHSPIWVEEAHHAFLDILCTAHLPEQSIPASPVCQS